MATADRLLTTAKYFRFERLEVWQLARKFTVKIYKLTKKFPKDELFGLVSQLRRAAISIILNIAEGSDRKSDIDFRRFLRISLSSLEEVVSGLYISLDQNFMGQREFEELYENANELAAKLNALINKLNKSGRQ
jgi:four helix bundle protein